MAALVNNSLVTDDQHADGPVTISTGEGPVVPSDLIGDVRNLPRYVTQFERDLFDERPEFEQPESRPKEALPAVEPQTDAEPSGEPMAPIPTPIVSFNGLDFSNNGAGHPPDTVGDVGPVYYVQAVNTSIGIYYKTNGSPAATMTFNGLWGGANTGTPCDTSNAGDPTVIYAPQYDRFIVADFAWTNIVNGPYYECVAVSMTSDPVNGGWRRYAIRADDAAHPWLPDYPKMGIWNDALYMSANMFDCLSAGCGSAAYKEVRAYAINLSKMVAGMPLGANDVIVADTNSTSRFTMLPSNYRGTQPAAGTPNYFICESQTAFAWDVFKFHVDFITPASSTFTGPTSVSQTSYVSAPSTVPQPTPGTQMDTLQERLMMQNQYRKVGNAESLWVNHTTGTTLTSTPTSIQWAQINVTGGTINSNAVQQQIYNNNSDGISRLSGALAVDKLGNMALGYTAVSSTVAPDIRYAGRLVTDPMNALPQSEVSMLSGVTRSVQTGNCGGAPCTRWGDYSSMSVDPTDDCTFWYTQMYFPVQGANWVTRIGSFKFPTCVSGSPTPTNTPTGTPTNTATNTPTNTPTATPTPTPTMTPSISGHVDYAIVSHPVPGASISAAGSPPLNTATNSSGNYSLSGFGPGAYTVTPSKVAQMCDGTPNGIFANDATLIARHIVQLETLTPDQLVAAKVTGNLTTELSALDASYIAQKVVGICLQTNLSGQWVFSPEGVQHPSGVTGQSVENYRAILMGDVSGDWDPLGALSPREFRTIFDLPAVVSLPSITVSRNSAIVLPLRIDGLNGKNVSSYQFDLLYDPAIIAPETPALTVNGTLSEGLTAIYNVARPGVLRVAVYGALPAMGDGVYLSLLARAVGRPGASTQLKIGAFRLNDGKNRVEAQAGSLTIAPDTTD